MRGTSRVGRTFAVCNANRHVGLALLLSGQYLRGREALPVVASYAAGVAIFMILAPRIFLSRELKAKQAAA